MAVLPARKRRSYEGVTCPHCTHALVHERMETGPQQCGACGKGFEAVVFRPPVLAATSVPLPAAGEGTAPCAVHERNPAVTACGRCGSFLCNVCRIDSDAMILCPGCFDRLSAEGALPSTQTRFRDDSGSAASATLLCFLVWPLAIIVGPIAILYAVRALRRKRETGDEDGKFGMYAVIVLAVGLILCSLAFWFMIFTGRR